MNILNRIIHTLGKEEIKNYKLLSMRTSTEGKRKDFNLLDNIRKKGGNTDEDALAEKFYGSNSKNPYYRLKNRLQNDLGKSVFFLQSDKNKFFKIHEYIALARYFQQKNENQIAGYYLKKAERIALNTENEEYLELIYSSFINLSVQSSNIDPQIYIEKRKKLKKELKLIRKVDELTALLKNQLQSSYNTSGSQQEVKNILETCLNKISKQGTGFQSSHRASRSFEALTIILIQNKDYKNLLKTVNSFYRHFEKNGQFNRTTHPLKLKMLSMKINALFTLGQFEESLKWTNILFGEMKKYHNFLYKKYLVFYYNSLFINYSRTNLEKAKELISGIRHQPEVKKLDHFPVFIHYNLSIIHFKLKEYKEAILELNNLLYSDTFKTLSREFRYHVKIVELMIRFDLEELELIEYLKKAIKKEFKSIMEEPELGKSTQFFSLLERMSETLYWKNDKTLIRDIQSYITRFKKPAINKELIEYYDWLEEKIK